MEGSFLLISKPLLRKASLLASLAAARLMVLLRFGRKSRAKETSTFHSKTRAALSTYNLDYRLRLLPNYLLTFEIQRHSGISLDIM